METQDKLIAVRTCNDQFEAEVLCTRLQSEGIDATIRNRTDAAYLLSPYGPTGYFEVLVRAADAGKADEVLK